MSRSDTQDWAEILVDMLCFVKMILFFDGCCRSSAGQLVWRPRSMRPRAGSIRLWSKACHRRTIQMILNFHVCFYAHIFAALEPLSEPRILPIRYLLFLLSFCSVVVPFFSIRSNYLGFFGSLWCLPQGDQSMKPIPCRPSSRCHPIKESLRFPEALYWTKHKPMCGYSPQRRDPSTVQ